MNRRPTPHSNFFSSLKQVEKRLKLDTLSPAPPQQPPQTVHPSTESLSSPLYLYVDHNHNLSNVGNHNSNFDNSETPIEFLSNSVEFPQTHDNPPLESPQIDAKTVDCVENDQVDEMGLLIKLLGLLEFERGGSENDGEEINATCSSCHCVGGFYDKVVGMKGPKCGKEMERLDGWIKHFRDKKIESFRLAHLLLGKATCVNGDDDDNGGGFQGVEFPSTVEDFLRHDPPMEV
ncbi:uncharacterized protein LOC141600383 [Silene latifolia]|uniref:uncharacterized protein LOC141600383 n=1 Tax=Silene latifolia TaxID=37657 RepID=UPI003D770A80